MQTEAIHPQTHMGPVALAVADLARSLAFYQERIGLASLDRQGEVATLGVAGWPLLYLHEQTGAKPVARGRTGLYHFALLLPDRPSLGRLLENLIATKTRLSGASDHGVSEAIYLDDPDGHGIELYRDRPRSEWPRLANDELAMTLDPLDAEGLLRVGQTAPPWQGAPGGTTMGHVHLHVAQIAAAEEFYVGLLGFELMQRFTGQASFIAAGGYHHHLGLNVWAGVGAPPPPEDAARLLWLEVVLPDEAALEAVLGRLRHAQRPLAEQEGGIAVHDPAQNRILLRVARAGETSLRTA